MRVLRPLDVRTLHIGGGLDSVEHGGERRRQCRKPQAPRNRRAFPRTANPKHLAPGYDSPKPFEMEIRRANQRGYADHGWLRSFHTFSFADYYDPNHMGFRALRVINEDRVAPGRGFPTHPHRDMEILTYVLEGALEHRDSMGNGSVIRPGEAQRLSAGTGITHSEFNASHEEIVHFLQIWIVPNVRGATPGYEQRAFPAAERQGKLRRIASPDGRDGSLTLRQDANVDTALLDPGQSVRHVVAPGRYAWLHVARGEVDVGGVTLGAGDGAAFSEPTDVVLVGQSPAEVLVFDLP